MGKLALFVLILVMCASLGGCAFTLSLVGTEILHLETDETSGDPLGLTIPWP